MVTCPSTSPENSFKDEKGNTVAVSFGAAGETQMIRDLFRSVIRAEKVLNLDADLRAQLEGLLPQLPPHKIGKFGQLQEWFFDFDEAEPTHRHTSHLYAFYPDDDISLRKTPEQTDAERTVLKRRGDINLGWSGAWKINQHARLEEPEECYKILHKMETEVSLHPSPEDSQISPSFEGNQAIQGVTAGIAEMLMQSHSGELSLLPALPRQWSTGAVKGLRARGGYGVDLAWTGGVLTEAILTASASAPCRLRTKTPVKVFLGGKEVAVKAIEGTLVEFEAQAGQRYVVKGL
jgi:alpha-L-fucosidase 2